METTSYTEAAVKMPPDYHMHTPLCGHAEGSPSEYYAAAREAGLPEICFCDHMPSDGVYDHKHRMRLDQYDDYIKTIRTLQDGSQPRVLVGLEADYYEGCEPFVKDILSRHPLDLVIGSVHVIGNWVFDNPAEKSRWDSADVLAVWRQYFSLITRLVDSRLYDVIGHFDLPKKFGHRIADPQMRAVVEPVLDRVAAAGMAIEINTSGLRRPVGEIYPTLEILQMMRARGIPICFGSDAHRPGEVAENFPRALALARAAGYVESLRFRQRRKSTEPLP